jgi:tetratricopeptide (TPR) repeat protein
MKNLTLLVLVCLLPLVSQSREAVQGMSQRVFKVMTTAQTQIDEENYPEARHTLEALLEKRLSTYEQAQVLNLVGFTWYQQNDIPQARAAYQQALALSRLPDSMLTNLLTTLGQLSLIAEDYRQAEAYLHRLLQLPDQNTAGNQVLLASALMGQDKFTEALAPLRQAIVSREQAGEKPRENWLSMLASVHYELQDYAAMRAVVQKLVILYPREQYLLNLAALHGQLGDTGRQMALVESLADDDRLRNPTARRMLANLFLAEKLPHKAALLLQHDLDKGALEPSIANLELLSNAWYSAAEPARALPPLVRAAKLSDDGELYLRVARLHLDAHRWDEAERAARRALDKGGLRQEGHAWLLRGMAKVRQEQFIEAQRLFQRAGEFEETERYARQWLQYVAAESARLEALG